MNNLERSGDLVLPQGTYALVQDNSSGNVEVIVGPSKVSLADSDKPVMYDPETRQFEEVNRLSCTQIWPEATEGQYLVLTNPVKEDASKHPTKGKQQSLALSFGNKINIPGPETFPLFPGQYAEVIDGHQLKSNEYLSVRVYNGEAAAENFGKTIMKTVEDGENDGKGKKAKQLITQSDLFTGNLIIIKGTDASFFIPPTGIEVLRGESGSYTRDAVTLERLEYCILLDQNGDKRYVQGPTVVFPKPTEEFVESNGNKKFRAIELNDNMGIYIKVIADYADGQKKYKAGDEIFITGDKTKIYFPRPEHAIIKYGRKTIHYAVAIPVGEARYVLNKETGSVNLVKGPKMFLADPRTEVIVKRVLSPKVVELMFPGNKEALAYNMSLSEADQLGSGFVEDERNTYKTMASTKTRGDAYALGDELHRSSKYTKPRTIQLDSKYDGAVTVDVWPGHAVQVVKKTGERKVIEGPHTILLEFDETLEALSLSTGKPKNDHNNIKTVYLQTKNNIVSDIVEAETKDMVNVEVRLSYRVNFMPADKESWFNVQDYIKLMTQHLRSVIRNFVKKMNVQDINENFTDTIRDSILGKTTSKGEKRTGRLFEENGMHIYDVEVLNVEIGDRDISQMLKESEKDTVRQNISLLKNEKNLEFNKAIQEMEREELEDIRTTETLQREIEIEKLAHEEELEKTRLLNEKSHQDDIDEIDNRKIARRKADGDQKLAYTKESTEIEVDAITKKLAAIDPKLTEALTQIGKDSVIETLAKSIKAQGGGLDNIFMKGGFGGIMDAVKGTPIEAQIEDFLKRVEKKTK